MRKLCFLLLLSWFWCISGYSQEIKTINDLRFRHFELKDGLPSQMVEAALVDQQGYLWVGTYNGAVQFNGQRFEKKIPGKVRALYQDSKGFIWVGTNDDLIRYNPVTGAKKSFYYQKKSGTQSSQYDITSIAEDAEGALLVGTASNGLMRYTFKSGDSIRIQQFGESKSLDLKNRGLYFEGGLGNWIHSLLTDSAGQTWVGSSKGLFKLKKNHESSQIGFDLVVPDELNGPQGSRVFPTSLAPGNKGMFWVLFRKISPEGQSSFHLYQYDPSVRQFIPYKSLEANFRATKVLEDREGNLWLGESYSPLQMIPAGSIALGNTQKKSFVFGNGREYPFVQPGDNILGINNVQSLVQDHSGGIWILSNFIGVYQIPQKLNLFKSYRLRSTERFDNRTVSDVFRLSESRVLITTWRQGVIDFNTETGESVHFYPGSPAGSIPQTNSDIYQDSQGRIWVTSEEETLYQYFPEEFRFEGYRIQDSSKKFRSGANLFLTHIAEDQDGHLWVGSNMQGLYQFDPDNKELLNHIPPSPGEPDALKDGTVLYPLSLPDGTLWFSTIRSGVYRLKKANNTVILDHFLKQVPNLGKVFMDSRKRLWVGSLDNGLYLIDQKTGSLITHFTTEQGLPSMHINDIWEADDGWLWLLTESGVARYHPEDQVSVGYFEEYGIRQGQRLRGSMRLQGEELLIGGVGDFYSLNLRKEGANAGTPPSFLSFDQIRVNGKPLATLDTLASHLKKLELNQDQNNIEIEFSGLFLDDPTSLGYAYQLEPFHSSWQKSGESGLAQLANIPPGDYTFRVKAQNSFGEVQRSLAVVVDPFWWNTTLAKTLYILLGLALVGWMLLLYLNYRRAKLSEAQELALGQMRSRFFANISHEFKTPLTLIQGPVEERLERSKNQEDQLFFQKLFEQTRRMSGLVNELVDLSRIQENKLQLKNKAGNIGQTLGVLGDSFGSIADRKSIAYTLDLAQTDREVEFDQSVIEKLVANLLSNAFNHTPKGGQVSYKAFFDAREQLVVQVRNSGEPIPSEELDQIFNQFYQASNATRQGSGIGLALVKELTQLLDGEVQVQSTGETGTLFELYLPLKSAQEVIVEPVEEEKGEGEYEISETDSTKVVLLVEDHEEMAEYVGGKFGDGYTVHYAKDGVEGLKRAEQLMPDVIISDVMMPRMDGVEMCQKIKQNEFLNHIPIVLLTAKADVESRIAGLESGADHYMPKPFHSREFMALVSNIISSRERLKTYYNNSIQDKKLEKRVNTAELRFVRKAVETIHAQLDNSEFSVEDFAEKMHMSRGHLYKKLKSMTGLNPSQFVRNVRLEEAAKLLADKHDTVSRIAYQVGFNNLSYFTKSFKEKYGVAPRDYKG